MRKALTGTLLMLLILGPFAAQVKAAEAFVDSLAELAHPDVIEPIDAGSDELSFGVPSHPTPDQAGFDSPAFEGLVFVSAREPSGFAPSTRRCADPPWPSRSRAHRLASLQNYLC